MFKHSPELDRVRLRERFQLVCIVMRRREFDLQKVVNLSRDKKRMLTIILKIKKKTAKTKYVMCTSNAHPNCQHKFLCLEDNMSEECIICERFKSLSV